MKKVVLYKRLSAPLMERLRERVEVLLVEEPGRDGLARLRDALPEAHGLLGASLRLDAGLRPGTATGSHRQRLGGRRQL